MNKLKYPSVVERYYRKFFYREIPGEDICVLAHSNKICLVTLSSNHKALSEGPIKSVSYTIHGKDLATQNKVHGKRKLQAIQTNPGKVICEVVSGTGNVYKIRCGVYGRLLEVNEILLTNTKLLDEKYDTNGYIGIILHKFCPDNEVCKNLMNKEQYNEMNREIKDQNTKECGALDQHIKDQDIPEVKTEIVT